MEAQEAEAQRAFAACQREAAEEAERQAERTSASARERREAAERQLDQARSLDPDA